jgi:hypothetical protein
LTLFLFALSVPFLGLNYIQGCSIISSHTQRSLKDTKTSPNPQYICFEPYVTLTYLWWSINQRQESHIKPYYKRVAIKTNRPSFSTEEQNSEYLFHFMYMLIPHSLLKALDLSNKDLIYLPLDFECSNSLCWWCFMVAYTLQTIAHPKSSNFLDLLDIS